MMEDIINISVDAQEENLREDFGRLTMDYVLDRIEQIAGHTQYLHECIEKLGESQSVGEAGALALGNIVESREKTNQRLLQIYEKMYGDIKPQNPKEPSARERALAMTERILSKNGLGKDEQAVLLEALETIRHME
ncbi:MAG: hypothetical protein ACOX8S_09640 [Christensenellales bacterium]